MAFNLAEELNKGEFDDILLGKENGDDSMHDAQTFEERIKNATKDNYMNLILEIANCNPIDEAIYTGRLAKALGINKTDVKQEIKKHRKNKNKERIDENIVLAHPAYDSDGTFQSLGFRRTVIVDGSAKEENFYIVSIGDNIFIKDGDFIS